LATLVIRYPDGTEQEAELAGQLTVGRADGNDLVLAEGGVSRKHARFFTQGADVMVEDQGSQNGTWVDGEKIEGPTAVSSRAQVVIGDYEISLKANGARASSKAGGGKSRPKPAESMDRPTSANAPVKAARATKVVPAVKDPAAGAALAKRPRPAPASTAPAGPVLRGLTGPWLNKTFALKGTMVVGRVPGVDIQIEDDSVSRRHAEIVLQGRDVVLRDLGSANGTNVNGAPLTEEMILAPGDIIQFGVVETTFEVPSSAMARRGGGLRKGGADASGDEDAPKRGGKGKFIIAGAVVLSLLVAGVVLKVVKGNGGGGGGDPTQPGPNAPVEVNIDEQLGVARQYSNPDNGEPNYDAAMDAVNKVLEQDPINQEANDLKRRIVKEKACKEFMDKGSKLALRLREEEALEQFAKITEDCTYYYKVKPKITDAIDQVKKKAKADCDQYMNNSQFKEALPRCQKFMEFACQDMGADQLYPASTQTLCIPGGPRKRNCWTPKDKTYLKFLEAKEKVDPGAPLWRCPELAILRKPKPPPDPGAAAKDDIKKRMADPDIAEAVVLYFDGKDNEAVNILQRVREKTEKAKFHKLADDIRQNISSVEGLAKEGSTHLSNEEPEKAEEPFREALALDEKIVLGEDIAAKSEADKKALLDRFKSYLRKNIQHDMSASCYAKGKFYMDRKDEKRACKLWRLGFSFYKGNSDLLKAVTNICTQRAHAALEDANDCTSLARVLDYEVTGDGTKEEYEKKKEELKCH
jgi:pSer/pThr/pTyr-binding forkhead associated (FHA) protein/tetratricopeptide (TPR) repeat protein